MFIELKKAIILFMIDHINDSQLVNVTHQEFYPYIYNKDGNHLIGGEVVSDFIIDAEKLLKDGR